jgi:hypothetical protein
MRILLTPVLLLAVAGFGGAPPAEPAGVFAFPNPARSHSTLRFTVPAGSLSAEAVLYAIDGRVVRRWGDGAFSRDGSGIRRLRWDLNTASGSRAASGVYLWALTVRLSDGRRTRRIVKVAVVR